MDFTTTGMLNEGNLSELPCQCQQLTAAPPDGIHIDMDRLKKGEVK